MIKEKENFPPKRESTSPDGAWRTVERKIRVTGSSHGGTENAQPPGPRRGRSQAARVLAQTAALVPQTGWRSPLMPTPHREGFLSHRSRPQGNLGCSGFRGGIHCLTKPFTTWRPGSLGPQQRPRACLPLCARRSWSSSTTSFPEGSTE